MDNILVERHGSDPFCEVELRSDIGGRQEQQDRAYAYLDPSVAFAIVCDGMGGTEHGALASQIAVDSMCGSLRGVLSKQSQDDIVEALFDAMTQMDIRVSHELGKRKGGTTAVAVFLRDGKLYWFSAGDSRLYIIRNGELVQATRDHNYFLRLDEQLRNGEITQERFDQEAKRGSALISYIGVGGLPVFDLTNTPLDLMPGDILLLTTDGLYKALPQDLITYILQSSASLSVKADRLMAQITAPEGPIALDNTTFVLIKINTRGIPND